MIKCSKKNKNSFYFEIESPKIFKIKLNTKNESIDISKCLERLNNSIIIEECSNKNKNQLWIVNDSVDNIEDDSNDDECLITTKLPNSMKFVSCYLNELTDYAKNSIEAPKINIISNPNINLIEEPKINMKNKQIY